MAAAVIWAGRFDRETPFLGATETTPEGPNRLASLDGAPFADHWETKPPTTNGRIVTTVAAARSAFRMRPPLETRARWERVHDPLERRDHLPPLPGVLGAFDLHPAYVVNTTVESGHGAARGAAVRRRGDPDGGVGDRHPRPGVGR